MDFIQDQLRWLLLDPGPSLEVARFIKQERGHLDLNVILEETFRRVDLGPRDLVCRQGSYVSLEVEFLLRHGASFESCDVNKLLEDTYRYIELGPLEFKRRAGARLSPEVDFLLMQGAYFHRVPCGLSQLVDDTVKYLQQSDQNRDNFLFIQATFSRIHDEWYCFLYRVYEYFLRSVESETLCHIIRFISRQRREFKIHTLPFIRHGKRWPYNLDARSQLLGASLVELGLQQGSDKVTMRAEGREITTFRNILQARSPYLRKIVNDNSKKTTFDIQGCYKTIRFVVLYAQSEPSDVGLGQRFQPCDSRQLTENTLNELINILYAADEFEMVDLFGAVEQHISIHGKGFIYAKNAHEIKVIANEVNAGILERYCDEFIATNLRNFTLFQGLPIELRINIWRQIASRPRLLLPSTMKGLKLAIPPHIAVLSRVCRESDSEIQRVWGKPRIDGINFEFDIIWLDLYYESESTSAKHLDTARNAQYCAIPAPYPRLDGRWEDQISETIFSCPCLKVVYLITVVLTDSDEFEYCRGFTNREPTTLVEARRWIEESAHQRLRELRERQGLPNGSPLPLFMLIDENEIKRMSADAENRVLSFSTKQY